MAETLVPGRQSQLFGAVETSFGVPPTLLATHAMRHTNFTTKHDPFNRVNSPEKKQSPGVVNRFDMDETAGCNIEALLRPSGILNTLAECSFILEHAMGAKANTTLATTVSASPEPTTTVFTLASVVGLAENQAILVVVNAIKYVRWITDLTGSAVTVYPPLPSAPASGAAVKGVVTYTLASALTSTLCFAHYRSTDTVLSRIVKASLAQTLGFAFARNDVPRLRAAFDAKTMVTAPTKPNAFTTVGTQNPPSGTIGELYVNTALYKHKKLDLEIATGALLRKDSFGCASAEGILMTGERGVTLGLDAVVGDEAVIYDNAESGALVAICLQAGFTEGNIVALRAPQVDFNVPDEDDPADIPVWPFKGICRESADGANDEVMVALA